MIENVILHLQNETKYERFGELLVFFLIIYNLPKFVRHPIL